MKTFQSKSPDNSATVNKSQSFFSEKKQKEESFDDFTGKDQSSVKTSFFQPALVQKKLNEAQDSPSEELDKETKPALEHFLGSSLSNIKVHNNPVSHEASNLIQAKAYTTGNHIFLGAESNSMSPIQQKSLLAHEAVHTVQQQSFSPAIVQAKSIIDSPQSSHEQDANAIARDFVQQPTGYSSPGLAMRRHSRIGTVSSPVIQRDIKDSKELANGKMELDFTKNDATAAGAEANESGWVKFHPNATAPESNEIRLIQISRVIDTTGVTTTTAGEPWVFGSTANQFRNNSLTTRDVNKNIAGGFHVDILGDAAAKRTKKSDATVLPYYNAHATGATGQRKGATKVSATLWDGPGHTKPIKYSFVTSAKSNDTGLWYGSALWGFEIYLDKGIAKIKDEYKSFREYPGETTLAALEKFNAFFQNPGTPGAPTK